MSITITKELKINIIHIIIGTGSVEMSLPYLLAVHIITIFTSLRRITSIYAAAAEYRSVIKAAVRVTATVHVTSQYS